eukprot:s430_g14.t1
MYAEESADPDETVSLRAHATGKTPAIFTWSLSPQMKIAGSSAYLRFAPSFQTPCAPDGLPAIGKSATLLLAQAGDALECIRHPESPVPLN